MLSLISIEMKKLDYRNKIAIVTGASSGIGKEISSRLVLDYGCTVYGIARSKEALEGLKEELGENFVPYPMDVGESENWQNLREYLQRSDTHPHILINCAGFLPTFAKFEEAEASLYERAIKINFMSCVYSCYEIMDIMEKGGIIANISSASALCPFGGVGAYSSSKSALLSFSQSIGCEKRDISVLCVLPGFVKTDIMKNQDVDLREKGIVDFFSQDVKKSSRKILKKVAKRKKRIVIGIDGHFMSLMYRLFPNLTPKLITFVVKKSGLNLFKKI